jgi:hypothetical protein
MMRRASNGTALSGGMLTAVLVGATAVLIARRVWPAYAAAEPTKAYTTVMLFARLTVGACCTACAGIVTTRLARDTGVLACRLGVILLVLSVLDHVFLVWADYPVWYHLLFFSYLVPLAGFAGTYAARHRVLETA